MIASLRGLVVLGALAFVLAVAVIIDVVRWVVLSVALHAAVLWWLVPDERRTPWFPPTLPRIEAPVTIERCMTIEVTAGKSIELRPNGTLQPTAGDTAASAVTFQPLTTAWSRIRINGGSFLLDGATIAGAGLQAPAALTLEAGTLTFQGLTITGATGVGLAVTGGTLDGSTNLVITGASASAATIPANQVGTLPTGSYTGNALDEILVPTGTAVSTSQTWHDLGVPYHLTGGAYLKVAAASGVAVLTIDPGTTLAFDKGAGMLVEPAVNQTTAATGALHAVGSASQPIVFTSAG